MLKVKKYGYLWGIAGMALFLPLAAIFRVFCNYFEQLKPIGMLMGDELYEVKKHKKRKRINLNFKELPGKI